MSRWSEPSDESGPSDDPTRFDLVPLMDVLASVVFFLVASLSAAVIAGVPMLTPASKGPAIEASKGKPKVVVTVRVSARGEAQVSVSSGEEDAKELDEYARAIPFARKKGGEVDARGLTEHLASIKAKFPGSSDVVVMPDDDVTYEVLLSVMDACRERPRSINGRTVFEPLFPRMIVSSAKKVTEDEG